MASLWCSMHSANTSSRSVTCLLSLTMRVFQAILPMHLAMPDRATPNKPKTIKPLSIISIFFFHIRARKGVRERNPKGEEKARRPRADNIHGLHCIRGTMWQLLSLVCRRMQATVGEYFTDGGSPASFYTFSKPRRLRIIRISITSMAPPISRQSRHQHYYLYYTCVPGMQ